MERRDADGRAAGFVRIGGHAFAPAGYFEEPGAQPPRSRPAEAGLCEYRVECRAMNFLCLGERADHAENQRPDGMSRCLPQTRDSLG